MIKKLNLLYIVTIFFMLPSRQCSANKNSALFGAIYNSRHYISVLLALDNGADPNAILDYFPGINNLQFLNFSALRAAITCCGNDVIALLLERGANPNVPDDNGQVALHYAVQKNVSLGGFHISCEQYRYENNPRNILVKLILDHGGKKSINAKEDQYGYTPLRLALNRSKTLVELLIDAGADVNCRDDTGETPLAHVVSVSNLKLVKTLLAHGARVDIVYYENQFSLLHLLAINDDLHPDDIEIAKVLIAHGAPVDAKDSIGETPIFDAAAYGKRALVQELLASGANPKIRSNHGSTCLHEAARYGQIKIAQLLLSVGVEVNAQDKRGFTPLHQAARKGNVKTAKILLDHGADLWLWDNKGRLPIYWANKKGAAKTVALLKQYMQKYDDVD